MHEDAEHCVNLSGPLSGSHGLGVMMFIRLGGKWSLSDSLNKGIIELITKVFEEQPLATQGLLKRQGQEGRGSLGEEWP